MSVGSPTDGTWSSSEWRPDNEFETDRVNALPVVGLLSFTDGEPTTKSGLTCGGGGGGGGGTDTVTCTEPEQLLVVSDSPATASAQAP